jgi:RimJ/RimL family protein N-acetyltransferase
MIDMTHTRRTERGSRRGTTVARHTPCALEAQACPSAEKVVSPPHLAGTDPTGNVLMPSGSRAPVLQRHQQGIAQPPSGESIRLKDGSRVLVRPVQTTDVPLLIDGFARLSPNSRRMRFLVGKNALTARELRYFTDIDHHDHEALGAVDIVTGRGVGVARYVRDAHDVHRADVAVTVVDEWQRRGLGSELMKRLAHRAQKEGIRRFGALLATDNVAVVALLRRMDADVELISYEEETLQYDIYLRCGQPCRTPFRPVAEGPSNHRPARALPEQLTKETSP